jgi:hypothetical protein
MLEIVFLFSEMNYRQDYFIALYRAEKSTNESFRRLLQKRKKNNNNNNN